MEPVIPAPRGDHLPLRAARFFLLCTHHAVKTVPRQDVTSPFSTCVCPLQVFAHTQVRDPRGSVATCWRHTLGTQFPWLPQLWGVLDLRVSSSPELRSFFAQHVHQCSGVDHEFSLFWLFRRGCQHYPGFGRRAERSFCLLFLSLQRCFAKSHASLRAHLSCFKVSSQVHTSEKVLAMDPVVPEFLCGATYPWRI